MAKDWPDVDAPPASEDDASYYQADSHDMATFVSARAALASLKTPLLQRASNSHERLFIAAFDGTWADAATDPTHMTNVGQISKQIEFLQKQRNDHVIVGYTGGAGTACSKIEKLVDGAIDYSYDSRIELMYRRLSVVSMKWLHDDPDAEIRVISIGFSRGAEEAPGFSRLVDERGLRDPSGQKLGVDTENKQFAINAKPALTGPGQIAQAVGLFDPVGTGVPRLHDRRLPPSVLSGFQLTAEDEHRGLFKSTSEIDQGMTPDGRFLGVMLAGAHADVGGGEQRDGLSIRAGNLMIDYLNALSDTPFLHKRPEPDAPGMNVVHRPEESMLLYRLWPKIDRRTPAGVIETLAPPAICDVVVDCRNAEPRDPVLASKFEFANVRPGPFPVATASAADRPAQAGPVQPGDPDYDLLKQGVDAVQRLESRMGRTPDLASDRLAASAALAARRAGLERIDHVVLDDSGEHAFVFQGQLESPFRRSIRIGTHAAVTTAVGESLSNLARLRVPPSLPQQARLQDIEQDRTTAMALR